MAEFGHRKQVFRVSSLCKAAQASALQVCLEAFAGACDLVRTSEYMGLKCP